MAQPSSVEVFAKAVRNGLFGVSFTSHLAKPTEAESSCATCADPLPFCKRFFDVQSPNFCNAERCSASDVSKRVTRCALQVYFQSVAQHQATQLAQVLLPCFATESNA